MLIQIPILVRESASIPAVEKLVALNPDTIARVEESEEVGVVRWWADGMEKPHKTRGTVDEFAGFINDFIFGKEEECEQDD